LSPCSVGVPSGRFWGIAEAIATQAGILSKRFHGSRPIRLFIRVMCAFAANMSPQEY